MSCLRLCGGSLASLLLLSLIPGLAAAGPTVAEKQIETALAHISDGQFLQALVASESAQRADESLVAAWYAKALAYEGLGHPGLGRRLLDAFVEADPDRAAQLNTDRATERMEARFATAGLQVASPPDGFLAPDDPAPYGERVRRNIESGRCAAALASAQEITWWRPTQRDGWSLLGGAWQCAGDPRRAVVAYRQYIALKGRDAEVAAALATLQQGLASIVVTLTLAEGSAQPVLFLDLADERIEPVWEESVARFVDLSYGVTSRLTVAGRGLAAEEHAVPALGPGVTHELAVAPVWIGLGQVRLTEHAPELCSTVLRTAGGEVQATPGGTHEVTAGTVTAVVTTEHGSLDTGLEVADAALVDFAPEDHLPAAVTLVEVPSGSDVRLFVEGSEGRETEVVASLAGEVGTLHDGTGVFLAPPHRFDSLPGGAGTFFVEHPTLGAGRTGVVLRAGEANAVTFAWKSMEGVAIVRARYEDWRGRRAIAEGGAPPPRVPPPTVHAAPLGLASLKFSKGARKRATSTCRNAASTPATVSNCFVL